MQLNVGRVVVTNGDTNVDGMNPNLDWSPVKAGDLFIVDGDDTFYTIEQVLLPYRDIIPNPGMGPRIILDRPYEGASAPNRPFSILLDFTPKLGLPLFSDGDRDAPAVFSQAMRMLDSLITGAVYTGAWQWSDTNDATASGYIAIDTTAFSTAAKIYINKTTSTGKDVSATLAKIATGNELLIQKSDDSTIFGSYLASAAPVDHTSWVEIPVTLESAGSVMPKKNAAMSFAIRSAAGSGGGGGAGTPAWTITSGPFTVPPIGQTVLVTVNDPTWIAVNEVVWVAGADGAGLAGELRVQSKSGNQITLINSPSKPPVGDMLKSVYDVNGDGVIDHAALADAAPWTGITGKPSVFPPDATAMLKSVYDTNSNNLVDHAELADAAPWTGITGKPLASASQSGLLAQLSGNASDYVGGDNACHALPAAVVLGGKLAYVSATQLSFLPFNGSHIKINGLYYPIPTTGVVGLANTNVFVNGVAGQNLAASTLYRVYVFNNAGTLTADFSTTAHATSTTAGNVGTEIKSGDDTRTFVGLIYTSGTQFLETIQYRCVRSWVNRKPVVAGDQRSQGSLTVAATATYYAIPNSACGLLSFADEYVRVQLDCNVYGSLAGATYATGPGVDGAAPIVGCNTWQQSASVWSATVSSSVVVVAEGFHAFTGQYLSYNAGVSLTIQSCLHAMTL